MAIIFDSTDCEQCSDHCYGNEDGRDGDISSSAAGAAAYDDD